MKLSEKILTLRKQHGLSQDDLAIKLDISRQAIFKWENDQSKPEVDKLKMLSALFNVSIDNLLDDNADIILKLSNNKATYSQVTALNTPKLDMAEKVNTTYTEDELKKIKIRKSIINGGFIGMIVSVIMLISSLAIIFTVNEYEFLYSFALSFLLPGGFILFGISMLTRFVGRKFIFPNIYDKRSYFHSLKKASEDYLKSNNYEYIILQHDLPVWFFYDLINNNKFGLYFNNKEQFVCPIQNYISFKYKDLGNSFNVTFSYFDIDGKIKEYSFLISTIRAYVFNILENTEDRNFAFNTFNKETINTLEEIKKYLDSKKIV